MSSQIFDFVRSFWVSFLHYSVGKSRLVSWHIYVVDCCMADLAEFVGLSALKWLQQVFTVIRITFLPSLFEKFGQKCKNGRFRVPKSYISEFGQNRVSRVFRPLNGWFIVQMTLHVHYTSPQNLLEHKKTNFEPFWSPNLQFLPSPPCSNSTTYMCQLT